MLSYSVELFLLLGQRLFMLSMIFTFVTSLAACRLSQQAKSPLSRLFSPKKKRISALLKKIPLSQRTQVRLIRGIF